MKIDVSFDFTTDSPGYWDGFWDRKDGLGVGGSDPDSASPTLQGYHQKLWSKELPCGEKMELKCGSGPNYLIFEQEGVSNPYTEDDFDVIASKVTEDILMLKVTFPEPEEEPLCYCSYFFFVFHKNLL